MPLANRTMDAPDMTAEDDPMADDISGPPRQRIFEKLTVHSSMGLLALAALGVAGNHFNVSLFFGVNFLLGSIATMLAVRLYSAGWAIIVGLVAAMYTYLLWGHFYAAAIFTFEAAFVALVLRRSDAENLVLWDAVFWAVIGLPLVWLTYHEIMHMRDTAYQLVMVKQAVNGVFNALIASILASHLPVNELLKGEPRKRRTSFRLLLIHCLLVAVLLPTVVAVAVQVRQELASIQQSIIERLNEKTSDAVEYAREVHDHNVDLLRLAIRSAVGMHDPEDLQQAVRFENLVDSLTGVLGIEFVAADSGHSTVWIDREDPFPRSRRDGGSPVAVAEASRESRLFVDERNGRLQAILSFPIMDEDTASGVVYAALAPAYFRDLFLGNNEQDYFATLVDQNDRVIAATDPGQRPMQAWRSSGDIRQLGSGVYQRIPHDERIPLIDQWRKSRYETREQVFANAPWDLVISFPAAGSIDELREHIIGSLWTALAVGFLAVFAAPLIARRVAAPLVVLAESTKVLPDRIRQEGFSFDAVNSRVREIVVLSENFRQMAHEVARTLAQSEATAKDLAQKERQLRIALENMPGGMFMIDRELKIQVINDRFKEMFELPKEVSQKGGLLRDIIRLRAERGDYGTEDVDEIVERRLRGYTDKKSARVEERLPSGRMIEFRRTFTDQGGSVGIATDITERKQAEHALLEAKNRAEAALAELKAAQVRLIQAEKMASLGQLTAGVAHEMKNPLNFVNNFAELSNELLDEIADVLKEQIAALSEDDRKEATELFDTVKGNLEKITEHGHRADRIVQNMLMHSRESSSEMQTCSVNAIAKEALNLAYHGARAEDADFDIEMVTKLSEDAGEIECFPQDLMRVFLNLIANGMYAADARKASADDPQSAPVPTITLETRSDGDKAVVEIRDNGAGIPENIREQIFTPFFTTKPAGEGTGLGLSLSYDIVVKQHGGTITMSSEPGAYTSFVVTLPRSIATSTIEEATSQGGTSMLS